MDYHHWRGYDKINLLKLLKHYFNISRRYDRVGSKEKELRWRDNLPNLVNIMSKMNAKWINKDAQSLESVSRAVKMLGMVPAEHMRYVAGREPSYVLAK